MRAISTILLALAVITALVVAIPNPKEKALRDQFEKFKTENPDNSGLSDEERFKHFSKNSDFIDLMNQKHGGQVEFKLNKFADRDPETDLKKMNGAKAPQYMARLSRFEKRRQTTKATLSGDLDWRTSNIVTPVKDQGSCGYFIFFPPY